MGYEPEEINDAPLNLTLAIWLGVGAAIIAVAVAEYTGVALFNEGEEAVLTSKLVRDAEQRLVLSHPVCAATMTTSVAGVVDHHGCYIPKGTK